MLALTTHPETLEARARNGEAAAFGALIRQHDVDLRGVAWSVVRSAHATDDVMQAAYEKAFRSIGTFDGRSAFKTWLYSIVHRTAIDYIRYENRRRHDDIDDLASHGVPPSEVAERLDLEAALDRLHPEQRAALMLTVGLGFSYDEAAEITGEARGTIASRVSRARRFLAQWELA